MACYYFKYTPATGSPLYLEDEPIKWDAVRIKLKRDRDWHGMNYEYTDEDIALEFDCLSGSPFIEEIYQTQGGDGYIGFEYGYYDGATEIPEYQGKINLSTRKLLSSYRISAMIERDGLHDKVKTRWQTKADMFTTQSIDGETINPGRTLELELHSKVLVNSFTKATRIEGDMTFQPFLEDEKHDIWFVFNTTADDALTTNIQRVVGSNLGPTGTNPVTSNLALLFDLEASGTFVFDISLYYLFNIKMMRKGLSAKPKIGDWTLDHWLEIRDINNVLKVQQRIGTQLSGFRDGQYLNDEGSVNASATLSGYTIDLEFGDKVYVYAHFTLDGFGAGWKGLEAYIKTYSTNFDIEAETTTPVSRASMLMVHEALTQSIAFITGEDDAVYSEFFGREDLGYAITGPGAYKAITNGFQIRRFATLLNPPKLSAQELLNSMNAIFCLGMGYEQINGENKMRIEDRGYFYQDVEIMEIDEIGGYSEEVATDKIHNTIQSGYSKYLDEGIALMDEYNTEQQYCSPIKNSDQPLDLRSTLIGSGYAIEITRRYQFKTDGQVQDSTKYDDDGFLIAVVPKSIGPISAVFFNDGGAYFEFTGDLPFEIAAGDDIVIDGSVSNDGQYWVSALVGQRVYLGTVTASPEVANITVTNLSSPYTTEKNEAFDVVTGIVSPETSYNLRHTPKRNLLNHTKWLNGGMYFKSAGELIRNTFVKQNGELVTQFDSGVTNPLGDINLDALQEKADLYLAQCQDKESYFIPEWVNFKARLSMSSIRHIRDCMTGQNLTGQNYGYITCRNQDGDYVRTWIYDLTYNPNTQEATFLTLKKEVIPAIPPSPLVCSDYADFTFADFEAIPDLSEDIEQCLFSNFN